MIHAHDIMIHPRTCYEHAHFNIKRCDVELNFGNLPKRPTLFIIRDVCVVHIKSISLVIYIDCKFRRFSGSITGTIMSEQR